MSFSFFFATEKSCCFFSCFQNKPKPWIWAQDYGQDWSVSRNNKEGVGCSFIHLIYLPIRSVIKRLPSGRLWEPCWGKRWMAVLSGCQNADQLRAKSEGQASPGGRCWLLVSILWLSSWILLRSSRMHSPRDPIIFSVLVWAPSQADPETAVCAGSFQGSTMREWESETSQKRNTRSCVMLWLSLWAIGAHPTGNSNDFLEYT